MGRHWSLVKVSVMREERVPEQPQQAGDGQQPWAVYLQVRKETDLQFSLLNTHAPCYWAEVTPKLFSLTVVVISGCKTSQGTSYHETIKDSSVKWLE